MKWYVIWKIEESNLHGIVTCEGEPTIADLEAVQRRVAREHGIETDRVHAQPHLEEGLVPA